MLEQQQENFQLISYTVTLQQTDKQGNLLEPSIKIPTQFCSLLTNDKQVDGEAQCLDLSGLTQDEADLKVFAGKGYDTKITIELNAICTGDITTCLNSNAFSQYIFADNQSFTLNIKEQQLNQGVDNLETKVATLSWDLDQTLQITSRISLQTSQTTIQRGAFLQKPQNYYHLSDASTNESYKTRANSPNESLIARSIISLDQIQYVQTIQNAQYSEILAQFVSILNALLLFGIIGAIIAKVDIQQFFIDQKLKEYYKLTAFKLLKQQPKFDSSIEIQLKQTLATEPKLTKENILRLQKELEEIDLNKELKKKFNVSLLERAIRLLIGQEKQDFMNKKRTIKCCGSSLSDQIPFLMDKSNSNEAKKTLIHPQNEQLEKFEIESQSQRLMQKHYTHIELIDKIDYDDNHFEQQLEKFLQDADKGFSNQDEHEKKMNQRLIDCLKKTYGFNN
ncbi:hypothetical protein ABPG72_004417 [Tetrahymena utriculariae]